MKEYCLERRGFNGLPLDCNDVRCDKCPNREEIYPMRSVSVDTVAAKLTKSDAVVHPNHYARWTMEPIEFIAINDLPWWLANVIKYCMRYDAKDGLQDLYKARSYLDMKIRSLEGTGKFWEKPVAEERALNGRRTTA